MRAPSTGREPAHEPALAAKTAMPAGSRRSAGRWRASRVRLRELWPMLAGLTLLALVLLPARLAALRGDDAWRSEQRGLLELDGTSLLNEMTRSARVAFEAGRPHVLGGVGSIIAWLFDGHPTAYRLFLIALTVAAAALLYRLVVMLGATALEGVIVLVILAGAIQFRTYHDALLGYFGIVQLVLVFTLASLIVFIRWLREGRRRLLVISFLLFLVAPMMYEIAYPLAGLHVAVAFLERRGRQAFRAALPFVALAAILAVASFIGRFTAPAVVESYSVSSSPLAILRSYMIQLFPPLPISSVILGDPGFLADPTKAELLAGVWRGAAVSGGLLVLFIRMAGARARRSSRPLGALAVVGVVLWLGPPLLLAAAPKFQLELSAGRGHIPVLIQVFGWALIATAGSLALLRAARRRSSLAHTVTATCLALGLGAAAGVVGYTNLRVVALETPVRATRTLADDAVDAGLLSSVPERSSLVFSKRDLLWPLGSWGRTGPGLEAMLLRRGGHRLDARISGPGDWFNCAPAGFPPPDCATLARTRGWVHIRARRGGGTVIYAASVPRGSPPGFAEASQERAASLRVFVDGDKSPPLLIGQTARQQPWSSEGLRWSRVKSGGRWAIYEAALQPRSAAPLGASIDDPRAQVNFVTPRPPGDIVRIYGTKRLLP